MKKICIFIALIIIIILAVVLFIKKPELAQNIPFVDEVSTETSDAETVDEASMETSQNKNSTPSPEPPITSDDSGLVTVAMGEELSASGATGKVTEVLEDSRCPADVECVQAGTVRVKLHVEYGLLKVNPELALDESWKLAGHSITFVGVTPEKISGQDIDENDYRFSFRVE